MNISIYFLFLLYIVSPISYAAKPVSKEPTGAYCSPAPDVSDYIQVVGNVELIDGEVIAGNYYVIGDGIMSGNSQVIGNIYATGNISLEDNAVINGHVYSEGIIDLDDNSSITKTTCAYGIALPSPVSYCENPPDVSDYTYIDGDLIIESEQSVSGNYYVTGKVLLKKGDPQTRTSLIGNIYAGQEIELENHSRISGSVYTTGEIILGNKGSNIVVSGGKCSGGEPIIPKPPIDLPVDELVGQCNDIFQEAAQSFVNGSELHMQGGTRIIDSQTNVFPFTRISGDQGDSGQEPPADSCGPGVMCGIKSPPSTPLSSYNIPTISGSNFSVWSGEVTVGGNNGDQYSGNKFGKITVGFGATANFIAKDYGMGKMYQINELNLQQGGTIKLPAGVYAIKTFNVPDRGKIEIIGDGDVYIFEQTGNTVRSFDVVKQNSDSQFYYIVNNTISFQSSDTFVGAIYVNGKLTLGNNVKVIGQVAAQNLTMQSQASIVNDAICTTPPVDDNQFVITAPPIGLTCEAQPVTLTVLKSDGTPDTSYSGKVTLDVTPDAGSWSVIDATNIVENITPAGSATYQFDNADNGEVKLGLSISTVQDVTVKFSLGALESNIADISFQSSMIKITQACTNPIAGQCINIANRQFPLTLTAYKDDESQTCINYNPDNIAFWSEFNLKKDVDVNNTPIGRTEADAVELPIVFTNGVAQIDANYPDAGQISIHLKDADIADITGEISTIVKPLKLAISKAVRNSRNLDASRVVAADAWIRASIPDYTQALVVDTFDTTVKAIIDCTVSSGVLKNCAGGLGDSVNIEAPSFTNTINLASSLIFPSAGVLGNLYYDNNNPAPGALPFEVEMTGGKFIYSDLAYDEVGTLGLQALSINYLDIIGNDITPSDIKVTKRFYPDYISYKESSFMAMPSCNADFSYLGEEAIGLQYTLMAHPQGATQVTKNYDDSLGYPVAESFEQFARDDFSNSFVILQDNTLPNYYQKSDWKNGEFSVALSLDPAVAHPATIGVDRDRTTPQGPFEGGTTSAIEYFIKLSGGDGEQVKVDSATSCSAFSPAFTDQCLLGDLDDVFHGRLQAGNGHGSEFQSIRTTVEATYFNGSGFVPMKRDSCTTLNIAQVSAIPTKTAPPDNKIVVGAGETQLSILNPELIAGASRFQFSAPNSTGKLNYFIDMKSNVDDTHDIPWLLDSGNAIVCPDAIGSPKPKDCIAGYVEFGLFRGNDRIIYRMQTFE